MSLFYQHASLMWTEEGTNADKISTPRRWFEKVNSLLPRRKKDEVKACQMKQGDFLTSSLLFAIHKEAFWWIETNITEYSRTRRLVLPELDAVSWRSSLAWKLYWIEVKQRILPSLFQYQGTLLCMHFFHRCLSAICSKETQFRLTQHPPRRAIMISTRESDRLLVGVEVVTASLWANVLFFAAHYTVAQIGVWYNYYQRRRRAARDGWHVFDREDWKEMSDTSCGLLSRNGRRYFYTSLGAGLGSVIWPGWGTLLGTALGDGYAEKQPPLGAPVDLFQSTLDGLADIPRSLNQIRWPKWFTQWSRRRRGGTKNDLGKGDGELLDHRTTKVDDDELICGCCQTTIFSSNPNSRDRAPMSSRACSHTICKSCVQQCHLAYMERTSNYEEYVRCPLCNAARAFSAHDHLVNRSLCAAIAAIERSSSSSSSSSSNTLGATERSNSKQELQ